MEEEFSVSRDNIAKTKSINIKVNDEEYKHYLTTSEIKHSQNFNSYKVTITNIPSNFLFHRNGTLFSIVLILTNNKKFNFEFTLSDFEGLKVIPDSMFTFANIPETNYRILTGFTETAKMPGTLDGYDTFFVPNNVIHIADEAFGNFEIRSGGGDGPLPFVGVYCSKKWLSTSTIPNNITKFIYPDYGHSSSIGNYSFVGCPFKEAIFYNVQSFGDASFALTDLQNLYFDSQCSMDEQDYSYVLDVWLGLEPKTIMEGFPCFAFNTNFKNITFTGHQEYVERYTFDYIGNIVGKAIVSYQSNKISNGLAYGKINFDSCKVKDEMINQYEIYDCSSITALYFGHHRMENIIDGSFDYVIETGAIKLICKNSMPFTNCFSFMHNLHEIIYDDAMLLPSLEQEGYLLGFINSYILPAIEASIFDHDTTYNNSLNCPYFYNDEQFRVYTPYSLEDPSLTDNMILDKTVEFYNGIGVRNFYNPDNPTFYRLSDYQTDVAWF